MTKPPFKAPVQEELAEQPWFQKAAAEARAGSRRYWAKGGPADKKYPVQPLPWWPEAPIGDVQSLKPRTRRGRAVK